MFYPQEMTRISIIARQDTAVAVTHALAEAGALHLVDARHLGSEIKADLAADWVQKSATYAELERHALALMQTLGVSDSMPQTDGWTSVVDSAAANATLEQIEREARAITERVAGETRKLEQLQSYVQQLTPIREIDIEVSRLSSPRHLFSALGAMPVENVARMRTSLARVPFVLLTLRQDQQQAVVWLLGRRADSDILERAARGAYLNPLSLPEAYQGTPGQILNAVEAEMATVRQRVAAEKAALEDLRRLRQDQLQALLWHVRASHLLADAIAHFGSLRYTYLVVGWVPTAHLSQLQARLKGLSSEIVVRTTPVKRSEAGADVPVGLQNPGFLVGFQQLLSNYGWPRYQELDPTAVIGLTFPVLYGAMFGDVGHGLLLALAGLLLASRKVRALAGFAGLGMTIVFCGLAATLFGFLYGSFFGFEGVLPALLFHPLSNIMQILLLAVGGGVVVLVAGFLISIVNAYVDRDWGRLLVGNNGLAGLLLYLSLLGLAAAVALPHFPIPGTGLGILALLSALAVMLSEPLSHAIQSSRHPAPESVVTAGVEGFFEVFETLISLLSNSLSYVRVGAFAVAHGGLSAVILILATTASASHGLPYWLVVALGNLVIVGFEGLVVGIQTLRLHYYEFFSKFFTGGGTRYAPLTTPHKANAVEQV